MKKSYCTFIFLTIVSLFQSTFANQPECERQIKRRYNYENQDKYGNISSSKIWYLQYYRTDEPYMTQNRFGNNNALLFGVVVDVIRGNQDDRLTFNLHCVISSSGKVLGIELER